MNTKIYLIFLFVSILGLSCKKEKTTTESLPKFEGITMADETGALYTEDTTDWRTDDKFAKYEQNLFDTLNFNKTLQLPSIKNGFADVAPILKKDTIVRFYPNPCSNVGIFRYHNASIINFVIVDTTFAKKLEYRTQQPEIAIDFTMLNNRIYRMYYVFQDSAYNIIGLGHGDILKNRIE
jgi:hypothetical protein